MKYITNNIKLVRILKIALIIIVIGVFLIPMFYMFIGVKALNNFGMGPDQEVFEQDINRVKELQNTRKELGEEIEYYKNLSLHGEQITEGSKQL